MQNTVNQIVQANLPLANATALTTATSKNIVASGQASVVTGLASFVNPNGFTFLNAGIWMLSGFVGFIAAAGTTQTLLQAGFNTVTGTLPTGDFGLSEYAVTSFTTAGTNVLPVAPFIVNVPAQGQAWFLVAQATFATSTLTAYGTFQAVQLSP